MLMSSGILPTLALGQEDGNKGDSGPWCRDPIRDCKLDSSRLGGCFCQYSIPQLTCL